MEKKTYLSFIKNSEIPGTFCIYFCDGIYDDNTEDTRSSRNNFSGECKEWLPGFSK